MGVGWWLEDFEGQSPILNLEFKEGRGGQHLFCPVTILFFFFLVVGCWLEDFLGHSPILNLYFKYGRGGMNLF